MADDSKKVVSLLGEVLTVLKLIAEGGVMKVANARFIDNGDGTISDKKTGLMWQKDGSENSMNFSDAEKYCKDSEVGGHKDWRLPTLEELFAIVDYKKNDPAIDPMFKCKSAYYWTSLICAGDSGYAWMVGFGSGYVSWGARSFSSYVRPVRQY